MMPIDTLPAVLAEEIGFADVNTACVLRGKPTCCGTLSSSSYADPAGEQVAVKVTRGPVHVGGRYRKLRRDISNSPWIPGKCVTSVQEELERVVLPGMRADLCKFMSAGAR
jgi:hypothetical protein